MPFKQTNHKRDGSTAIGTDVEITGIQTGALKRKTGTTSLPPQTLPLTDEPDWTDIPFETTDEDTDGFVSGSGFEITIAAVYRIKVSLLIDPNNAAVNRFPYGIRVMNGSDELALCLASVLHDANGNCGLGFGFSEELVIGDQLKVQACCNRHDVNADVLPQSTFSISLLYIPTP